MKYSYDRRAANPIKVNPEMKGVKVTWNGGKLHTADGAEIELPKGEQLVLTGKQRWQYAGRGDEYLATRKNGDEVWADGTRLKKV